MQPTAKNEFLNKMILFDILTHIHTNNMNLSQTDLQPLQQLQSLSTIRGQHTSLITYILPHNAKH